jgi:hypothetical protein
LGAGFSKLANAYSVLGARVHQVEIGLYIYIQISRAELKNRSTLMFTTSSGLL